MPNITTIQKSVSSILEGLSPHLTYHTLSHTLDVAEQCIVIATAEGITDKQILLELEIAALYHDAGFLYAYAGHEAVSCTIAREQLPGFGVTENAIDNICALIMATKVPQLPGNKLQQIICDADLDYFGRDDFFDISNNLQKEVLAYKIVGSKKEWEQRQLQFLTAHSYFTNTARQKRDPIKQLHIKKIMSGHNGVTT